MESWFCFSFLFDSRNYLTDGIHHLLLSSCNNKINGILMVYSCVCVHVICSTSTVKKMMWSHCAKQNRIKRYTMKIICYCFGTSCFRFGSGCACFVFIRGFCTKSHWNRRCFVILFDSKPILIGLATLIRFDSVLFWNLLSRINASVLMRLLLVRFHLIMFKFRQLSLSSRILSAVSSFGIRICFSEKIKSHLKQKLLFTLLL